MPGTQNPHMRPERNTPKMEPIHIKPAYVRVFPQFPEMDVSILSDDERWPTLGELRVAVRKALGEQASLSYKARQLAFTDGEETQIGFFNKMPYPSDENTPAAFFLSGYVPRIINPVLDELVPICGHMGIMNHHAYFVYWTLDMPFQF